MRSGTCKMKVKLDIAIVPKLFEMQTNIWHAKTVGFSPTSTTLGHFFQAAASIRVRLMCNLSSEKAARFLMNFRTEAFIHGFTVQQEKLHYFSNVELF